jgi:hypothetical protein
MCLELSQIISLPVIVGSVLGGTGVISWVLTYWQLHEEKNARARGYIMDLVITPEFRQFLYAISSLHSTLRKLRTRDELMEHLETVASQSTDIRERMNDLARSGVFFFIPEKLEQRLVGVLDSLTAPTELVKGQTPDPKKSAKKLAELSGELKKILGLPK